MTTQDTVERLQREKQELLGELLSLALVVQREVCSCCGGDVARSCASRVLGCEDCGGMIEDPDWNKCDACLTKRRRAK